MKDPRVEKLAELLVNYSVAVKPGEQVYINGPVIAAPLIKAVYAQVLRAGGNPLTMVQLPGLDELTYKLGSDEQLDYVHPILKPVIETFDVYLSLGGSENTKALSGCDPARIARRNRAQAPIFKTFMERVASGKLRWVGAMLPTNAQAQDAQMSLDEYENFVYGACLPDLDDPVGYWKRFSAWQQKIVDWLHGRQSVHVIGPETDLTLSIAGRRFVNCAGRENMPDGEVFTGPVEDSVNGKVCFSYPAIFQGREVSGVRLWFENGKVVKASAEKNEDFLLKMLDTDQGSRYVGEFAIGTNAGIQQFTGEILYDEKIGGSFHMALGAGFPETGSTNDSAIHWDMICDLRPGGEIWVDDVLLHKDGKFVVEF